MLNAIQIAANVDLQQYRRTVSRSSRRRRRGTSTPQCCQIELVDKYIDDSNRIVIAAVVIETVRQQRDLVSVPALNESLHLLVSTNAITLVSTHKVSALIT